MSLCAVQMTAARVDALFLASWPILGFATLLIFLVAGWAQGRVAGWHLGAVVAQFALLIGWAVLTVANIGGWSRMLVVVAVLVVALGVQLERVRRARRLRRMHRQGYRG